MASEAKMLFTFRPLYCSVQIVLKKPKRQDGAFLLLSYHVFMFTRGQHRFFQQITGHHLTTSKKRRTHSYVASLRSISSATLEQIFGQRDKFGGYSFSLFVCKCTSNKFGFLVKNMTSKLN